MQISENWLREWVSPVKTGKELAHQITMAGLEVDAIEAAAPAFSGVVVAQVATTRAHPNADSLTICEVFDGSATHQVVCGAPNVRAGLVVPFARIGALLPGDFAIKKAKLRGEESFGMLCGAAEIGLEDRVDGLLELPTDAPIGADVRDYLKLDDNLIEVDLTPNRADCLSVRGIAREVAALNALAFVEPQVTPLTASLDEHKAVQLQAPAACPRYLGRIIRHVDVSRTSPLWLVEKLRRAGVRSVDVVVDVTNLVLLELGQPLHAFDLDKLQGDMCVRLAQPGEKLTLLNEQALTLEADTLVIADQVQAQALAGVMGGAAAAISATTRHIFLECAFFAPLALAGKARRYGLHTDASHRFERGVDWQLQARAMELATTLILALAGGEAAQVKQAVSDEHLPLPVCVPFSAARANHLLALDLAADEMAAMLSRLGFELVASAAGCWQVTAPSWRFDIEREEDLIEEVARLYGYDKLPSRLPAAAGVVARVPETQVLLRRQADLLVDRGYREAISYSFVEPGLLAAITPTEQGMPLVNPISQELSVMRTSLWAGLLTAARYNLNRQVDGLRLFESGLRFVQRDGALQQENMLAGLSFGPVAWHHWQGKGRNVDFYDLKGDVEALLALAGDESMYRFEPATHHALHPGQSAAVYRAEQCLGYLGRIHPALAEKLDVSADIYLFELSLEGLQSSSLPAFASLSDQPAVRRDLAFSVAQEVPASRVIDAIRSNSPSSLQSLQIFDVYQGDKLAAGQKSLALALVFQDRASTLKEVEITAWIDRIVLVLKQEFNAQLRD